MHAVVLCMPKAMVMETGLTESKGFVYIEFMTWDVQFESSCHHHPEEESERAF